MYFYLEPILKQDNKSFHVEMCCQKELLKISCSGLIPEQCKTPLNFLKC